MIYPLHANAINLRKSNNFHLKYDKKFDTLEDALVYVKLYKSKGFESFIHYTGNYEVYIGLFSNESEMKNAKIKLDGVSYVYPDGFNVLVAYDNQVFFSFDSTNNIDFFTGNTINYGGKTYRGAIRVKRFQSSDLTVINYIDLEEYLYGVIPKEMPVEWNLEALKAQAIAARNFAVMHLGDYETLGFDLTDDINSQVYGGVEGENIRSNQAVDETKGLLLKYNDIVAATYYHSNSGGQTESVENVWQSEIPYLKGVSDEYSENVKNSSWEKTYTLSQISLQLNNAGYDVGSIYDVVPVSISENNRVLELLFKGSKDDLILEKGETRKIFGYFDIKSMWFDVQKGNEVRIVNSKKYYTDGITSQKIITASGIKNLSNYNAYDIYNGESIKSIQTSISSITFKGKGFGHGIGMSQWGAKVMAERGHTYEDILLHYYSGTYLDRRQ
jgi:stage II sporulation protein D